MYSQEMVTVTEIIYGKDLLSQGGTVKIGEMFADIMLDGKKALDIGAGLGGVDFYLAHNYNVEIVAIDPELFIVQEAQKRLTEHAHTLKGSITFQHHTENALVQFADESFDVVFSKESLLHVPVDQKVTFLQEMHRILKPEGFLIIIDWLHSTPEYSPELQEMMTIDAIPYNLITPDRYKQDLIDAGFYNYIYTDLTEQYGSFTLQDCERIKEKKQDIVQFLGDEAYESYLKGWTIQHRAMADREILVCSFRAQK